MVSKISVFYTEQVAGRMSFLSGGNAREGYLCFSEESLNRDAAVHAG